MQAAIVLVFALVAVASANPGVLLQPAPIAVAPVVRTVAAPIAVAAPVAVPVATSTSYKIRAPAAKVLAAPALAPAQILLH